MEQQGYTTAKGQNWMDHETYPSCSGALAIHRFTGTCQAHRQYSEEDIEELHDFSEPVWND
jgi:hypothetical protein